MSGNVKDTLTYKDLNTLDQYTLRSSLDAKDVASLLDNTKTSFQALWDVEKEPNTRLISLDEAQDFNKNLTLLHSNVEQNNVLERIWKRWRNIFDAVFINKVKDFIDSEIPPKPKDFQLSTSAPQQKRARGHSETRFFEAAALFSSPVTWFIVAAAPLIIGQAFVWDYFSNIDAVLTSAIVSESQCDGKAMEHETVRYNVYKALKDPPTTMNTVVLVCALLSIILSVVGMVVLYRNKVSGVAEYMSLGLVSVVALITAIVHPIIVGLGKENKLFTNDLQTYGRCYEAVSYFIQALQTTEHLCQKQKLPGVQYTDAESKKFNIHLYALQLRIASRMYHVLGLESIEAAISEYNNTCKTMEYDKIVQFIKFDMDEDYKILRKILPRRTDERVCSSYDTLDPYKDMFTSTEPKKDTSTGVQLADRAYIPTRGTNGASASSKPDICTIDDSLETLAKRTTDVKESIDIVGPLRIAINHIAVFQFCMLGILLFVVYMYAVKSTSMLVVAMALVAVIMMLIVYYTYFG
jgi:hypothetical protein